MAGHTKAIFLVTLFVFSSMLPVIANAGETPDRSVSIVVPTSPNGMSTEFSVSVPEGEIVTGLDLKLEPGIWPLEATNSISEKSDWASGSVFDGVDFNSTGLKILPMSHEWDFEGSSQGWTIGPGGGWAHGYDSTLGASGGVHSGSSAIYTYTGNYPTYMGGPYWATSPVIDCSSCQGTWDFKYWSRLGVESASFDHAYVAVKNTNGAWVNVYSNPYGTVNDGSFTQKSHDVSSYANGNSQFQVRFGLGSSDGSIQYTGWNVDDVLLEPRGNTGTGVGNWTSQPFGPGAAGNFKMPYSVMSLDAYTPIGSIMFWSLIDFDTGQTIPGFDSRQDFVANLASLDPDVYPRIQFTVRMESAGDSPVINSINFGGYSESFDENPTNRGWSGHSSHSNGRAYGSSTFESPEFTSNRPFSGLTVDYSGSGTGNFQCLFDGNWMDIPSSGEITLPLPITSTKLRWNSASSWGMDRIDLTLNMQSYPLNLELDVGFDGVSEFAFSGEGIGPFGWQNQLADGSNSEKLNLSSGEVVELLHPHNSHKDEIGEMTFHISSEVGLDGVIANLLVDNTIVVTKNVGYVDGFSEVNLDSFDKVALLSAMDSSNPEIEFDNNLDFQIVEIQITATQGEHATISGISIPYHSTLELDNDESDLIAAINAYLPSTQAVSGYHEIQIPTRMDSEGKIIIHDHGMNTRPSPVALYLTMTNQTDTLVAGDDWYEFESKFDLSNIGINDAAAHFYDEGWSSKFDLIGGYWSRGITCSIIDHSCTNAQGILLSHFSHTFSGSFVTFSHRIRISSMWPDETALTVSSSIEMGGQLSAPAQIRFGPGWSMGVQQDIVVEDWYLSFNNSKSPSDALYIDTSGENIVSVQLRFTDLDDTPRSGSFDVKLFMDNQSVDSTQELNNGVATLRFTPNTEATDVHLSLTVTSLGGQEVTWMVDSEGLFLLDDVAPVLLSSNVAPLDHRTPGQPLSFEFTIGDRPVLPRHSKLYLSTSWDGDHVIDLLQPEDLNNFQGLYHTIFDTYGANEGDVIIGWLEVVDPAGHHLVNQGTRMNPLFQLQFKEDGAPNILAEGLGWADENTWFHPGSNYSFLVPMSDVNGYGDIEQVLIDFSSGSSENLTVIWSAHSGCSSSNPSLSVESCDILGEASHFDEIFTLSVTISLDWDFNPDSSIMRDIMVMASDDSGQSQRVDLPDEQWRYSGEVEIDTNTIGFMNGVAYIAPLSTTNLVGELIWAKGGGKVETTIEIVAVLSGVDYHGLSHNGLIDVLITSPNSSGIYTVQVDVINLPAGGIDRTDSDSVVAWLVVDASPPRVTQLVSPSLDEKIEERDWKNLPFEFVLEETEGLQLDSLRMHWLIMPNGMMIPEMALLGGNVSLEIISGTGSGSSIPSQAILNLDSILPETTRQNSWDLWVWVTGNDLAGQQIESSFNSRESPVAVLTLENRQPELTIDAGDVLLSNPQPSVGQKVNLNITVHNIGQATGISSVRVEAIEDGGTRRLLEIAEVNIPGGESASFETYWYPEEAGTAWIEVSMPDGTLVRTSPEQVDKGETTFIVGGLENADGGMLTGFVIIALLLATLLGYLLMSGPSKQREYDMDVE
ncbi:MAG: hypothetical protein QGI21_01160 [Candidatus Poseidoniaceae archaeon]|jgi:hypothetical protein|nr:hypothetical protein [Candidatus Poseidoniaceae archaeon]